MDAAGWAKIIEAVRWPVVAVVLGGVAILLLRGAIARLLDRLKDIEIEKGKRVKVTFEKTMERVRLDLDAAREKRKVRVKTRDAADDGQPRPVAVPEVLERLHYVDEYSLSEAEQVQAGATALSVIERAWIEVEQLLRQVVSKRAPVGSHVMTADELFRKAAEWKLLEPKLLDAVFGLLSVRNETITSIAGWQPSKEQLVDFVHNSREVARLVAPYLTMDLPKQPVDGERTGSGGL